jgi:hypothetical protein
VRRSDLGPCPVLGFRISDVELLLIPKPPGHHPKPHPSVSHPRSTFIGFIFMLYFNHLLGIANGRFKIGFLTKILSAFLSSPI